MKYAMAEIGIRYIFLGVGVVLLSRIWDWDMGHVQRQCDSYGHVAN